MTITTNMLPVTYWWCIEMEREIEQKKINKQAVCLLGQVTDFFCLLAQSHVDFDRLHLNELPNFTTQTLYNVTQWHYHPTEISTRNYKKKFFNLASITDVDVIAHSKQPLFYCLLSEELSLWRDALSPFIFLTLTAALLKLSVLT